MTIGKHELLAGLRALLDYHRAIGIEDYPNSEPVRAFLRIVPESVAPGPPPAAGPAKAVVRFPATSRFERDPVPGPAPASLAEIAAEVQVCRACELQQQRIYPVAGGGPDKVRLMIVGEWLSAGREGKLHSGLLFGVEQDQMLSRMLLAINLSADQVFITNLIKCALPHGCRPEASHVENCVRHLHRQISALQPEFICTMGSLPARALLKKSLPLSRLRGQVHHYEVAEGRTIPVIATYHPTYLLQNPEMKQATWLDLQLLAKKMGLLDQP